jgi:hypothetical protein
LSFAFSQECSVVQMIQLGAVLLGLGWIAAEIHIGGEVVEAIEQSGGPEWRRTNDGWIKVGRSGAAALNRPDPQPASEPSLHPGIVAVFMLLSGVLSLSLCERHQTSGRDKADSNTGMEKMRAFWFGTSLQRDPSGARPAGGAAARSRKPG